MSDFGLSSGTYVPTSWPVHSSPHIYNPDMVRSVRTDIGGIANELLDRRVVNKEPYEHIRDSAIKSRYWYSSGLAPLVQLADPYVGHKAQTRPSIYTDLLAQNSLFDAIRAENTQMGVAEGLAFLSQVVGVPLGVRPLVIRVPLPASIMVQPIESERKAIKL